MLEKSLNLHTLIESADIKEAYLEQNITTKSREELLEDAFKNDAFLKGFKLMQKIIDILLENKHDDGICYVTQLEIAHRLNISQNFASRMIRRLYTFDNSIEIVTRGKYIVHCENLFKTTQFQQLLLAYCYLAGHQELIEPPCVYKEVADKLSITVPQLQFILGFFYNSK